MKKPTDVTVGFFIGGLFPRGFGCLIGNLVD